MEKNYFEYFKSYPKEFVDDLRKTFSDKEKVKKIKEHLKKHSLHFESTKMDYQLHVENIKELNKIIKVIC